MKINKKIKQFGILTIMLASVFSSTNTINAVEKDSFVFNEQKVSIQNVSKNVFLVNSNEDSQLVTVNENENEKVVRIHDNVTGKNDYIRFDKLTKSTYSSITNKTFKDDIMSDVVPDNPNNITSSVKSST